MGVEEDRQELVDRISRLENEVKLRTEQLIASTSRAYSFLDSLNLGFVMCDVKGEVVLANSAMRAILAEQSGQPADTSWTLELLDALEPALQIKNGILKCLASGQPLELKAGSFGKHVLHLFIAPMVNDGQKIGAVLLAEDITEQKVLERSKDEFLSIASHELRTPLTAIRGNASLIKKYYAGSLQPDTVEMVNDIHESSVRLIGIVNDFLDVSSLEQGKMRMNPEAFALKEVIDESVDELKTLCESKGIVLQGSDDSSARVKADKQRIKQVVINLVGNAVKFTERGNITISTRVDGNFVYVTVTDTGRGMPPEAQRLLFRKFQQAGASLLTRDTTKGTGLGLYISKLIIELSGGKIELTSSVPGQGSAFTFSLPLLK